MIHPSATVHPSAKLAEGVSVGAWSIIGAEVEVGEGTWIGPHVVINGPTRIGRGNRIYQFNSLGDVPQDKKYGGERTRLEIGQRNVIREFCTFNRGTGQGGGVTSIGDDNWIMAYVHVAHDCRVGSGTVMANGATLAGHVAVEDFVTLGAFTVVHQYCLVGAYSFSAMGTVIFKDVPPYVTVAGNSARPHGINTEGLRRRGMGPETMRGLRRAYKAVYKQGLTIEQAVSRLRELEAECPEAARMTEFFARSTRGIVR